MIEKRKLSTILFANFDGYSGLLRTNEEQAIQAGFVYIYFSYRHDYLSKDLHKIPEFIELTSPT